MFSIAIFKNKSKLQAINWRKDNIFYILSIFNKGKQVVNMDK